MTRQKWCIVQLKDAKKKRKLFMRMRNDNSDSRKD